MVNETERVMTMRDIYTLVRTTEGDGEYLEGYPCEFNPGDVYPYADIKGSTVVKVTVGCARIEQARCFLNGYVSPFDEVRLLPIEPYL